MEWSAFERVWGPILPHERIDAGLAQVCLVLVKLLGKGTHSIRDFMPSYYRELTAEAVTTSAFERLMRRADADD